MLCCAKLLSHVWLYATLWSVACQAPPSMGLSRQQYWGGLLCSPSGDLPNPWIAPASLMSPALTGGFFTTSTTWDAQHICWPSPIYTICGGENYNLYMHLGPSSQLSGLGVETLSWFTCSTNQHLYSFTNSHHLLSICYVLSSMLSLWIAFKCFNSLSNPMKCGSEI